MPKIRPNRCNKCGTVIHDSERECDWCGEYGGDDDYE